MKRILKKRMGVAVTIVMLVVLAMLAAACGQAAGNTPVAEEQPAAAEQPAAQTQEAPAQTADAGNAGEISAEEAKKIAIDDAGVNESDLTLFNADRKIDDGIPVYHVLLITDSMVYNYDINAQTGAIVEMEKEPNMESGENIQAAGYISIEEAKRIALEDAGFKESDVTFTEAKVGDDDGVPVFKIEFISGTMEYEYRLNPETGKILEMDADPVDD